jgi:hypothetical protein
LEAKVDGLVALLESRVAGTHRESSNPTEPLSVGNAAASQMMNQIVSPPDSNSVSNPDSICDSGRARPNGSTIRLYDPDNPSSRLQDDIDDVLDAGFLHGETAAKFLNIYRNDLMPQFPFVQISSTEDVYQMQTDRPALLQAVLAAAAGIEPALQVRLGQEVHRSLKAKMLTRSSYNLDLLQAVLVMTSWYQLFFTPQTHQYTLMIHFAISLVNELRLDKNPNDRKRDIDFKKGTVGSIRVRKSDEIRALLGTFYIASM